MTAETRERLMELKEKMRDLRSLVEDMSSDIEDMIWAEEDLEGEAHQELIDDLNELDDNISCAIDFQMIEYIVGRMVES